MKVEKIIQLKVELDSLEFTILSDAVTVLERIKETMEKHDCNTFKCSDEFHYELSDLKDIIDILENIKDITEIYY